MIRRTLLAAAAAAACLPLFANAQMKYVEGTDYAKLPAPIEVADTPKVIEFFWFGCPHCNAMRPALEKWLKDGKPQDVVFEYIPATFDSKQWQLPAQAYYTMVKLGNEQALYDKYFDEIFVKRNRGMIASVPEIKKFFVENGVSPENFDKAWKSLEVAEKMNRAGQLFGKSGLDGVPAFIVNGQYVVQPMGDDQKAYERTFDIIKTLSHQGLAAKQTAETASAADKPAPAASAAETAKPAEAAAASESAKSAESAPSAETAPAAAQ